MKRDYVGLTNAQKHDLIIKFNQEREEIYNTYHADKAEKKKAKAEENKEEDDNGGQPKYNKLYRQLGPHSNNNKDIRRQLQEEVDLYTDNQLGTNLTANFTPGYTMTKHNQISSFKDTF